MTNGGAEQAAIATARRGIHQAPVIVVDSQSAYVCRCRVEGVGKRRRRGTGQAISTQTRRQQIIRTAVITHLMYVTHQKIRRRVEYLILFAGSEGNDSSTHQGAEHHSFHGRSLFRSEERRVGKECRSRWWPDH